jgi:hypothetical protein
LWPPITTWPLVWASSAALRGQPGSIWVKVNSASLRMFERNGRRPGAGRGDLVGGNVVADLEQRRRLDPLRQFREVGQRGDVGPLDQFLGGGFRCRRRRLQHRGVHHCAFGQRQRRVVQAQLRGESARIGDRTGERRCRRGLRRAQPDRVVFRAGAAGEVAGKVRSELRPVAGACPIPMHPMQPAWWIRTPAAIRSNVAPIRVRSEKISRDEGLTSKPTASWVWRPATIAAA